MCWSPTWLGPIAVGVAVGILSGCTGVGSPRLPEARDARSGAGGPPASSSILRGEMVYFADATRFTDCVTGRSYPVAQEADLVRMQETYIQQRRAPGAPLYVMFEGMIADRPRMEGRGTEPSVVVTRFIEARADGRCAEAPARHGP